MNLETSMHTCTIVQLTQFYGNVHSGMHGTIMSGRDCYKTYESFVLGLCKCVNAFDRRKGEGVYRLKNQAIVQADILESQNCLEYLIKFGFKEVWRKDSGKYPTGIPVIVLMMDAKDFSDKVYKYLEENKIDPNTIRDPYYNDHDDFYDDDQEDF